MENYSDLYVSKNKRSMDDICSNSKFSYQKQQQFIHRWFKNGNKKLLLFHGLGSGKTCSSILAIEAVKNEIDNVFVCTPASLKENFKNELKSECGKYKKIPSNFNVLSHQGFLKESPNLSNSIVVIDEVQNIISKSGTLYKKYFDILVNKNYKNLHVVLLSATPMFDRPDEIALTLNLLRLPKPLPTLSFYTEFLEKNSKIKNENKFFEHIYGYVSAFKGISKNAYAKRSDETQICTMSDFQLGSYTNSVKGLIMTNVNYSQAFLSGPRMAANMVYSNSGFGVKYRPSDKDLYNDVKLKNLQTYSTKFYSCIQNLQKQNGLAFVYSNFVKAGGIDDFALCLKANGYKELTNFDKKQKGLFFGIFKTGKDKHNKQLVQYYNNIHNINGKYCKIILGSPAMKEGISLKNTQFVHLLEPYWNISRTEQIIGRAIRFCSHLQLPPHKREVQVINYVTRISSSRLTVDQHIMNMANKKFNIIKKFQNLLYRGAVDCPLFYNSNGISSSSCYKQSKNIINIQPSFNSNSKIFIDENNVSLNINNIEKNVLNLITLQTFDLQKSEKHVYININLYNTNLKKFKFQDDRLNAYINNISIRKSNNLNSNKPFALIDFVTLKKRRYKGSGDRESRHLKFNAKNFKKLPNVNVSKLNNALPKENVLKLNNELPKENVLKSRSKIPSNLKTCPVIRRPNELDKCPSTHPFLQKTNKKRCCYKYPTKQKGVTTHNGQVFIDGKLAKSFTMKELEAIITSLGKSIKSKIKKNNMIKLLK